MLEQVLQQALFLSGIDSLNFYRGDNNRILATVMRGGNIGRGSADSGDAAARAAISNLIDVERAQGNLVLDQNIQPDDNPQSQQGVSLGV